MFKTQIVFVQITKAAYNDFTIFIKLVINLTLYRTFLSQILYDWEISNPNIETR